ncbi:hypothetical protein BB561_000661 [Smittium simulii]|uniref:Uncharacterized protein n=1 Tax=Smittium simulii TaxID=133385 RepID=A0A2T9YY69_9FUNG|nr:hypothetical protein BB561_000661 [Smittium simulii]
MLYSNNNSNYNNEIGRNPTSLIKKSSTAQAKKRDAADSYPSTKKKEYVENSNLGKEKRLKNDIDYITSLIESSEDDECLLNQIADTIEKTKKIRTNTAKVTRPTNYKEKDQNFNVASDKDKEFDDIFISQINTQDYEKNLDHEVNSANLDVTEGESTIEASSIINVNDPIAGSTEETIKKLERLETEFINLIKDGVGLIKQFDSIIESNQIILKNHSEKLDFGLIGLKKKLVNIKSGANNLLGLA